MSVSLKSDCSVAGAAAVASAFAWNTPEERDQAVRALVPVVRAILESYDHFLKMQNRRLRPLTKPSKETDQNETE